MDAACEILAVPSSLLRMHVFAEVSNYQDEVPIITGTFEGHLPAEFIFLAQ